MGTPAAGCQIVPERQTLSPTTPHKGFAVYLTVFLVELSLLSSQQPCPTFGRMSIVTEKPLLRRRLSRADALRRRDAQLSEEITGWAATALFPIADVPNRYAKLPWRRIRKTHGLVRGTLFAATVLARWPFELVWEVVWLRDSGSERLDDPRAFR
jgi:hypothetical protein